MRIMNTLDRYLSAIEEILKTQSEDECRKNVYETLEKLKEQYPDEESYINEQFFKICKKYDRDFLKDLTSNWSIDKL